jgi:hypothetical protein
VIFVPHVLHEDGGDNASSFQSHTGGLSTSAGHTGSINSNRGESEGGKLPSWFPSPAKQDAAQPAKARSWISRNREAYRILKIMILCSITNNHSPRSRGGLLATIGWAACGQSFQPNLKRQRLRKLRMAVAHRVQVADIASARSTRMLTKLNCDQV